MASRAEAEAGRHRYAGQWVLVDSRFQLLSVGAALYRGTSPRGALDVTARNLLMPRMRVALLDGQERAAPVRNLDEHWRTWVLPVLGPVSQVPLAVLGCYTPADVLAPAPPLVGAWEWRVTPPGPDQQMRTFWAPALFDLYDIPRPGSGLPGAARQPWWEGPQWLDDLVLDSDRAEMRRVLDGFIHAETDGLFIHSYRVRSPATGEVRRLRLAGRSYVADKGPDKWFRGISTRVDDADEVAPPPPSTAAVMDAAFAVSADPLCAIDTDYEHIYMTSANFGELGVDLPAHRHLPKMVHPEDVQQLRNFLKEAATRPAETIGPVTARFATGDGTGWTRLAFTGTGMRLSSGYLHHVLCRVTIVSPG